MLRLLAAKQLHWNRFAITALLMMLVGCGQVAAPVADARHRTIKYFTDLGSNPTSLIEGKDGALYGTLQDGGKKWEGVVFKVNKDGSDYTVLHHFTGYRHGADGSWPQGVIEATDGFLYGTTQTGGYPSGHEYPTGPGTVFKVGKDGGEYTILHRFGATKADGLAPWAGVIEGPDGALYGTTAEGGSHNAGTIFKIGKDGSAYTILHHFSGGDDDGATPMAALLSGSDGLLYGTADSGGKSGPRNGTLFTIRTDGSGFKVLHSFPSKRHDGRMPQSSLIEGRDAFLYGTTQYGGENDAGTVFRIKKDGSRYKILHSFSGPEGRDGMVPKGIVMGIDGTLYGATEFHGPNGAGTAFELNSNGSGFAVLHAFGAGQQDGQNPSRAMVIGTDGAFYGMTKQSRGDQFATSFKIDL